MISPVLQNIAVGSAPVAASASGQTASGANVSNAGTAAAQQSAATLQRVAKKEEGSLEISEKKTSSPDQDSVESSTSKRKRRNTEASGEEYTDGGLNVVA